ncbi:zinc finger protein 2 homolog isoform X2 [Polistes fuscatus]|nr:zinc finger protein 2 homolog isoform X2 [Polistes fuscatus]
MKNDDEFDKENTVPSSRKCRSNNSLITAIQSNINKMNKSFLKKNCKNVIESVKTSFSGEELFTSIPEIITKTTEETNQQKVSRKLSLRETKSVAYKTTCSPSITKRKRRTCVNKSSVNYTDLERSTNVNESKIIQSNDSNEIKASMSNTKDSPKEFCINNDQSIHTDRAKKVFNRIRDRNENNSSNKSVCEVKAKNIKCSLIKSNMISMKKGNSDHIISHKMQVSESNQLVSISNDVLSQEASIMKTEMNKTVSNTNPSLGDEAESNEQITANSTMNYTHISKTTSHFVKNKSFMAQFQTEVFNEVQLPTKEIKNNCKMNIIQETIKHLQTNFNERYKRNKNLSKISNLISDEQKKEIETYYEKDMTVVDSEIVEKNLTINNKNNIKCNICSSLFRRLDKCKVHVWSHLNMKPYKCKICDFATGTITNVRCHIRKRHLGIKPFGCEKCGKRYNAAIQLEKHLKTHSSVHSFQHKDIHCSVREKDFKSEARLQTHMLTHNKDNLVICKICCAYFSSEMALERHIKNIHTDQHVCRTCNKSLKSRKTLLNHKNVHSPAKYKCHLCSKVYKSRNILNDHILKHKGIRKYKCEICSKSFAQKSHLDTHKAVHSNIKYHCPGCNNSFNRRDNMKVHTKRCKIFLSNPELKDLLNKKERTIYTKNINDEVTPDTTMIAVKNNESLISKETDTNVIPKDIIIEKNNINQQNNSQYVYNENIQNNDTIRNLDKRNQLYGLLTENAYDIKQEESTVIQNVLTSDRF